MWQLSMKFLVKLYTHGCVCRFLCPLSNTICRETLAKYLKVIAHKKSKRKALRLVLPLRPFACPLGPRVSSLVAYTKIHSITFSPSSYRERERERNPLSVCGSSSFSKHAHITLSLSHTQTQTCW